MDSPNYQVVIVGASLAGAACAAVLGQAGIRVALIDKVAFPRRKPCGEGLCSIGLKSLARIGVSTQAAESWPYKAYEVEARGREFRIIAPWGGIGMQRYDLDNLVLDKVRDFPTVALHLGERVEQIQGKTIRLKSGELKAQFLVIADGANSHLARSLGATERRYGRALNAASAMFKGTFGSNSDAIKVSVADGWELYGTRVGKELLNLSVLATADSGVELRGFFGNSEATKKLFSRMDFTGQLVTPVAGRARIGNIRRSLAVPDTFLVGDAREEFDPCGGMGMAHALMSGMAVASTIELRLNGQSHPAAIKWCEAEQQRFSAPMRRFTGISKGGLTAAKRFPWLLGLINNKVVRSSLLAFSKGL